MVQLIVKSFRWLVGVYFVIAGLVGLSQHLLWGSLFFILLGINLIPFKLSKSRLILIAALIFTFIMGIKDQLK